VQYVGDGWYSQTTEEGTWLFSTKDSYLIPIDRYLREFIDSYIIYYDFRDDFSVSYYGVMQPDGRDIILPVEVESITPAVYNGRVKSFILNTGTTNIEFIRSAYTTARYRLVGLDGSIIGTGNGILSFNDIAGYYIQGTDHFAFLDDNGVLTYSIPFMGYSFD